MIAGALAYFLAAELGLAFASKYAAISPVWPASGLAVAMIRRYGSRLWPAVAIGAFAANALVLGPGTALIIAAGNTLEAVAGGIILRRLIERQSDTIILARTLGYALAAGFATMISATMGVGALHFTGVLAIQAVANAWLTWWTGDALGILLVTSALLALRHGFEARPGLLRAGQVIVVIAAMLALLAWTHRIADATPAVFLAFPLVFLASRWFGPRGGTWTVLAFAIGLIAQTASGTGPFTGGSLNQNLLGMQLFLAVLALVALVLVDLHRLDLRMPGAVFIAGAAIAVVAAFVEHRQAADLEELRFKQLTEIASERIRERMAVYGNAMRSAASLVTVSNHVTRADWRDFVASLTLTERYPGITGVGVVVPVRPSQLDSFVAAQQASGAPDFSVKPVPGGVHPRAPGDERFIVQFIEPAAKNAAALGTDVASETTRREAALAARDTGLPAISGPITLIADPRQRLGFHFYLPVYDTPTPPHSLELRRAHFRCWVFGRFIIQDFFDSALMPLGDAIIAEIFDGKEVDSDKLLMSTWATWGASPTETGRQTVTPLPLAGHPFTIRWHTGPSFVPRDHRLMTLTGSVIVLLAILLAALVANLQSLRQRATAIAERMTGELAASNERFGLAIAGTMDGIWDWDLKERKLWGSPRCRQMLGYDEASLPLDPTAWRALLVPEDQAATRAAFDRVRNGDVPNFDIVQRYRHKDGRIVHLHNQAFAVRDGTGHLVRLVGALTDITLLVQAQEQLRAAISVMEDGFGLFNADDRVVLYNEPFIDEGTRKVLGNDVTGRKFEEIVRAFANHDMPVDDPNFDREAWIAQRMERHRNPPESPIEVQWSGGRWMRISERRTSDGGYVGIWSDVSAIKLAEQRLLTAINTMDSGFALFDAQDRLIAANNRFVGQAVESHLGGLVGRSFEDIIRAFVEIGPSISGSDVNRERWIKDRVARHRDPEGVPFEQQLGDGRWERVSERRTDDGGYVGIWTDITAVKVAEQRLLAAIDAMVDGFALFDADDRLVYYNKGFIDDSAARHFPDPRGHTFEEIIRAFAYDDVTAVHALLGREDWIKRRLETHRNPADEPFEQQMTDGKWYRISERRLADGGCLGIWSDITAFKHAEARLRDAIESINEGFALFDSEMRYVVVNSNLVDMYPVSGKLMKPGARMEDVLRHGGQNGEYPGVATAAEVEGFVTLWMDRFTSGERYLGEGEMPDGRCYLVSHHPTSDGGYVSIRADITAQKKREAELNATMGELEVKTLELAVLADELETARRAADLANLGKSQFLANMAHELRTPLNAINGFSELILTEMFGAIQPERYKSYVEFIHQGGSHLLSLTNDILDLSKIEAGRMELHVEAVPTEQVVYQAIESLRKAAEDRKVALHSDIGADCPILHADTRAVRQILLNLLSNAVKFTPPAGNVTLGVRRVGETGIEIEVADTGIGMSPEEIGKALEPYGQVESDLTKKHQGTGLGLPLVKSLAELHGGGMSVVSEKGKGTVVTVFLPWHDNLPRALK
ncbi:MAG TPA: PAS-domain containing protein [Dongiaceae bacterium]|nr:PAS-domain containing protein [Dongiaceae bacterium]